MTPQYLEVEPGVAPHVDLLLRCAGANPGTCLPPFSGMNWQPLPALVEHHGMGPHVHQLLVSCEQVPPGALEELRRLHDQASEYSLFLTATLLHLVEAFDRDGIPLIALKGPALSQQLYGDPGMRDSVDLDLLVRPRDVEAAAVLLGRHGYLLESEMAWLGMPDLVSRCTELTFRSASGTAVDLHWANAPADFPCRISEDRLWSSVTSVSIAGREVPVLAAECLLVYLCAHGSRHCWSKLRWLCDIAMLVKRADAIDWNVVHAIAAEAHAVRAVNIGLLLVHDLLHTELPPQVLRRAQDDQLKPFVAEVTRRLLAATPTDPPSAVQRTVFNARLATTGWRRARHMAALMKAPTDADAEFLKLPRQLIFLYYPFRAARLAVKYGRMLVAR